MAVDVKSEKLHELVDANAQVEKLATGFTFTEGPVWNKEGRFLLFSDMPADIRRRWSEADGVTEVANPSNKGNGMTYDAEGRLLVCEHVTSSLVRMDPDGKGGNRETLATHYDGKELNSPNDVIVANDGSIYFSDPWYGRMPVFGIERERELDFQGVYRIPPGAAIPSFWSTTSSSRTASASHPTSRCCTSTTRLAHTSASSIDRQTGRSQTDGCSSTTSAQA